MKMKNISIYSLIGLAGLCMFSCTDDYTDWADPQTNEQEAAVTIPDFSASKAGDIDLSNPGKSIKLFNLSNATLPEGYTLGNVRVEFSTENGKVGELESGTDGVIDSLSIQELVVNTYGKRPTERPFTAQVYANAISNGQALLINAGSFAVNFTPAAPFIDEKYYLVGDMFTVKNDANETLVDGWSTNGMTAFSHSGADVYEDSKFTIVFTTTADNQYWKIIPKANAEGEFWGEGVLGTITNGDDALEGTLTTSNPQAGMIAKAGMYKMTLDMMEYSYTLEELNFAPYIYEVGNNTSWNGTCPLSGLNFDGKYRGFAYLNGEFKYRPNLDNWTGDWEKTTGDALAGTLDENGAGNIDAPETGFYMMEVDLTTMTYKHTLISTIGLIGSATPSGWDADTDMAYNEEDGSWNLTTELADGEIKIRANDGWDINWGGSIAEPTFNAGNINVTAGKYTIKFIPRCDGMNQLTLTKN